MFVSAPRFTSNYNWNSQQRRDKDNNDSTVKRDHTNLPFTQSRVTTFLGLGSRFYSSETVMPYGRNVHHQVNYMYNDDDVT